MATARGTDAAAGGRHLGACSSSGGGGKSAPRDGAHPAAPLSSYRYPRKRGTEPCSLPLFGYRAPRRHLRGVLVTQPAWRQHRVMPHRPCGCCSETRGSLCPSAMGQSGKLLCSSPDQQGPCFKQLFPRKKTFPSLLCLFPTARKTSAPAPLQRQRSLVPLGTGLHRP